MVTWGIFLSNIIFKKRKDSQKDNRWRSCENRSTTNE